MVKSRSGSRKSTKRCKRTQVAVKAHVHGSKKVKSMCRKSPRKQSRKSREDERLAAEVRGLKSRGKKSRGKKSRSPAKSRGKKSHSKKSSKK